MCALVSEPCRVITLSNYLSRQHLTFFYVLPQCPTLGLALCVVRPLIRSTHLAERGLRSAEIRASHDRGEKSTSAGGV